MSLNDNIQYDSSQKLMKIEAYKLKSIGKSIKNIYDFLLTGNSRLDSIYMDKLSKYTLKDLHKIIKGDMPFYYQKEIIKYPLNFTTKEL